MAEKRYVMVVDSKRCIGCNACVAECMREWEIPLQSPRLRIQRREEGTFPAVHLQFLRHACMHCDDAPCVRACPTGASYKTDEGFVEIDLDKCVGCKYCIQACPYSARSFREDTGAPEKCTWCMPRVESGKAPVCVTKCPQDALIFGDANDPESDVAKAIARGAEPLFPEFGTEPRVLYIPYRR